MWVLFRPRVVRTFALWVSPPIGTMDERRKPLPDGLYLVILVALLILFACALALGG